MKHKLVAYRKLLGCKDRVCLALGGGAEMGIVTLRLTEDLTFDLRNDPYSV